MAWSAESFGKIVKFTLRELDQPADTVMDQIAIGDMPADAALADPQIFSSFWNREILAIEMRLILSICVLLHFFGNKPRSSKPSGEGVIHPVILPWLGAGPRTTNCQVRWGNASATRCPMSRA